MSNKIKDELKKYYNMEAEIRNDRHVLEWKHKPREDFLSQALSEKKTSLLEIGAGTGKDSKYFADKGLKVVAIDMSSEMIRLCVEKGIESYVMDYSDVRTLGMKFDCIWSMNSLLHLEKAELPSVLSELDSVLNPEGLFYMGVYGGKDKEQYLQNRDISIPRYFSFFSDESLKHILAGQFDIVSFETVDLDTEYHFQSVTMRKKNGRV